MACIRGKLAGVSFHEPLNRPGRIGDRDTPEAPTNGLIFYRPPKIGSSIWPIKGRPPLRYKMKPHRRENPRRLKCREMNGLCDGANRKSEQNGNHNGQSVPRNISPTGSVTPLSAFWLQP